jgi:hypothetical protein
MPRHFANLRPIFVVRVGGDVSGRNVSDVAIEGLFMEVAGSHAIFKEVYTTCDLLRGVDTYDANVIRLLENIQAALALEPSLALLQADEVA